MRFYRCKRCSERFLSVSSSSGFARCPACHARLSRVWMPPVPRADPGTYARSAQTYASMDDFVTADARRLVSAEVDFGLYWREPESKTTHRAAWIAETEELYVVKAGPPRLGGGHVEVLARGERRRVDSALEGWERQCGRPGSMGWLRERSARVARTAKHRRGRSSRIGSVTAAALGAAVIAFSGWGALPHRGAPPRSGPASTPSHVSDSS